MALTLRRYTTREQPVALLMYCLRDANGGTILSSHLGMRGFRWEGASHRSNFLLHYLATLRRSWVLV